MNIVAKIPIFSSIGGCLSGYPSVYLHELGHAAAMKILCVDVNPSIQIPDTYFDKLFGPTEGHTDWGGDCQSLTRLGNMLGFDSVRAAVSAAGPMTDVAQMTLALIAAQKIQNFAASSLALGYAFRTMVNLLSYAVSDLVDQSVKYGDFSVVAKETGISSNAILLTTATISSLGFISYLRIFYNKIDQLM